MICLSSKNSDSILETVVRCPPVLSLTSIIRESIFSFSSFSNSFLNWLYVSFAKIDTYIYPIFLFSFSISFALMDFSVTFSLFSSNVFSSLSLLTVNLNFSFLLF